MPGEGSAHDLASKLEASSMLKISPALHGRVSFASQDFGHAIRSSTVHPRIYVSSLLQIWHLTWQFVARLKTCATLLQTILDSYRAAICHPISLVCKVMKFALLNA